MTAQCRVILTQPPVSFFGVSQHGCGIGKQPPPVSVMLIRCVSRRSNTVPHSSSSVRNCRLRVGCEILKRRAPAEMLPHSTMQTKARSNVRSSKALMQNLHDRYRHSAATRKSQNVTILLPL